MKTPITSFEMNPARFYTLVDLIEKVKNKDQTSLNQICQNLQEYVGDLYEQCEVLARANNSLLKEMHLTSKQKSPSVFDNDDFSNFAHTAGGENFLRVMFEVTQQLHHGYHIALDIIHSVRPGHLVLSKNRFDNQIESFEALQHMTYEFQLNKPVLDKFLSALMNLEEVETHLTNTAKKIVDLLDSYYQKLLKRHSVEGIEIHRDPIITDLAMSVYENVDAHGEIADGKKPDEISAYSMKKAEIIAETLKIEFIADYIKDPSSFGNLIRDNLILLQDICNRFSDLFREETRIVREMMDPLHLNKRLKNQHHAFNNLVLSIDDLDPKSIIYKERAVLLTAEERFNLKFRNETLKRITTLINQESGSGELIQYILNRKAELRTYFQDENSFYVCKIGSGNAFSGAAPGTLEVIPGQRPVVNLEEIFGSGFQEVKSFFNTIEEASIWNDLFLATSPSKTTDKSNVLLVGPMGCGKSQVLRAVGGDKKSIGIFAQGSDFFTCWMGEAQKNPKRLFEAGLKLQKESRKHVHFLIDEIDAVLNQDRNVGSTDLTLEFQILMDGVVHYPHLSVWGATNNPERIPMPMIRRFSKVLIVGELGQNDRIKLLQQFSGFLPLKDISDDVWDTAARKLEGATGDVIRKVIDHIWRTKMSAFVNTNPSEAQTLVAWLNLNEKFQIASFDEKRRTTFRELLGRHVSVNPHDILESVDLHLNNFAIRSEINMAKDTYGRAHAFLNNLSS